MQRYYPASDHGSEASAQVLGSRKGADDDFERLLQDERMQHQETLRVLENLNKKME